MVSKNSCCWHTAGDLLCSRLSEHKAQILVCFVEAFGTNSIRNVESIADARRFSRFRLGFRFPFSNRLISAWLMPERSDSWICVIPALIRASMIARVISGSGCIASYSGRNSSSDINSFDNSWRSLMTSFLSQKTIPPAFFLQGLFQTSASFITFLQNHFFTIIVTQCLWSPDMLYITYSK